MYGAQDTRIPGLTHPLSHGSTISLGQSISIKALSTPCHTTGSLCFFATEDQHGKKDQKHALFSGDTLFVAGCGRFFEGSAKEMYMNLVETLGSLPPQTAIYPGHEYTAKNLEFALSLEPENEDIRNKLEWARKVDCTVPSQIQDEWLTNPFMRVNEFARREGLPEARESGIQVMQRIRALKDAF